MTSPLSHGFLDGDGRTWLDSAHQGKLPLAAADAAHEAIDWKLSPHQLSQARFLDVPDRLRSTLARLVRGAPDDIALANSASYGLHAIANAYPWVEGDEVLVMTGDFPSDILPWLVLEDRYGVRVRRIVPADRVVAPDELAAAITPRTRVFCTTWVHSFSGYAVDLDALGQICRERGVFFVANGSQAVGARPIDVGATPIDALVSVGFKWLCGPYGTGFAWIRPELRERLWQTKAYWLAQLTQADLARDDLDITLRRGPHDLDIFGTANFNQFVPWTVSVEHLLDVGIDRIRDHDDQLVTELVERLPEAGMDVLVAPAPSARSTLVYFSHPDRSRNAGLHASLAEAGIHVSSRGGGLRASPHLYNGSADIDRLVEHLRSASPGT
jgi:selenocysteine lyase/cysteine desulfurase